ncbi:MAG: hypothetical protein PHQ66_03120 [Candidatus Nanoarchaeia archaeon]|nr:hypothetical protein [Candidatus Nanoarchaeia archaeon]MDD5357642.1 hypothetical protein [Candidatus Nanoarchaeia archaeon]MDD5588561.1 hypothetical protein [Candidatus Nanoarchaeia archaeon]
MNKLCEKLGHVSTGGVVTVDSSNNRLYVYDFCKKCSNHYRREPTKEEFENYKSLLNKSN